MNLVFMFPGQSSRYPGMLDKLVELHPANRELLAEASDLLNWDLGRHFAAENPDAFARNLDVQVGVFVANHMFLQAVEAGGVQADLSLGLSLGEWNHLVHIGAVTFQDALLAVKARGEAYDDGPRGWMASVQPIDFDELKEALEAVKDKGLIEIVNLNSPRQQVISGEEEAVQAAITLLEQDFYVQPEVIERQVPMHSSLFEGVGARFRRHLEEMDFEMPKRPYIPNRVGKVVADPTRELFVELLATHVHEPVLWRQSIDHILANYDEVVFMEVGPRSVLHNLLQRKWTRNPKFRTDSRENTGDHLADVFRGLREVGCSPR